MMPCFSAFSADHKEIGNQNTIDWVLEGVAPWNPRDSQAEFGFADKALGDAKVQALIEKYIADIGNDIASQIEDKIGSKK